MRTYGRVQNILTKQLTWVVVQTDAGGHNDLVYATTLIQCLKLNLGESPFYANYGIPAHPSVVTQVQPDFFVNRTQQQFAAYFASLIIVKASSLPPTYRVNIITNYGVTLNETVAT